MKQILRPLFITFIIVVLLSCTACTKVTDLLNKPLDAEPIDQSIIVETDQTNESTVIIGFQLTELHKNRQAGGPVEPETETIVNRITSSNQDENGNPELIVTSVEEIIDSSDVSLWDGSIASDFSAGRGVADDPYQIASSAELAYLSQQVARKNEYVNTYFIQTANLDLNNIDWLPIGGEHRVVLSGESTLKATTTVFKGHYNGNGFFLCHLKTDIERSETGLFGSVANGSLENISVYQSDVQGTKNVGGIVGKAVSEVITACYYHGKLTCASQLGGGIAGSIVSAQVNSCGNMASIYCNLPVELYSIGRELGAWIGGITGSASYSDITDCFNSGAVQGFAVAMGGIVGDISSRVSLERCFNTGAISSSCEAFVGGIIGSGRAFTRGIADEVENSIIDCYNLGKISAQNAHGVGGIAGYLLQYHRLENCYNVGQLTNGSAAGSVDIYDPIYGIFNYYSFAQVTGAIVGEAVQLSSTLGNLYYKGDSGVLACGTLNTENNWVTTTAASMTIAGMASPNFAIALGDNFKADTGNINQGYPILITINYNRLLTD
ncbi:MAG TPA: hypothetical protein VFF80_07710 [Bacillota bacterium]|nr:hypothetical protein [Bacillota bacterium]